MKLLVLSAICILTLLGSLSAQDITYEKAPAQLSLVYPLGTSGKKGAHQDFSFSFNLLAGVTGQVNGFEMAGLGNVNKADVQGFQMAGLWNTSGGTFAGARLGGLLNIAKHNSNGIQAAGLFNYSGSNMNGLSIAGFFNNASGKASGVQVAGLFNKAKILRGFQMGALNVADTVEKGMSIGIINIVRKGGHSEWELSISDYQNIGLSFKHGTKAFYNIYNIGFNVNEDKLWSAGLGFGHIQKISSEVNFQPEAVVITYFPSDFKDYKRTISYRVKLGITYNLSDNISLSVAPSIYYADKETGDAEGSAGYNFTSLRPLGEHSNADNKSEIGLGFSVGVIYRNN